MASLLSRPRTTTARINALPVLVEPRETVLQAALRAGVDFPNSCRVGGCGACKCRLVEGSVRELTETAYLLTEEELAAGTILACQSVPRGDVRIELDATARRRVAGRVLAQERLTHDTARLRVQLDESLDYKSGQFATLHLDGVSRSYSFATPPRDDGEVSFIVRRVPGGALSPRIVDEDLSGHTLEVEGPSGDFWLRPSDAPMLLVAGGSGLAPILALLREAADAGVSRPATLLFGARTEADLYALDEIDEIARRWKGAFRFVPVLSEAAWEGARGLVTAHIPALLDEGAHAYLCGPPAMVDAAAQTLAAQGISPAHVHADRFTTQADVAPSPARHDPPAGALHYLKFFMFHGVGLLSAMALLIGGRFVTGGLLAVLALYMVGDAVCGDDTSTPVYRRPGILTAQLWMALPLLALIVFSSVWSVSAGDPLGFGAWLTGITGYDLLAAREATAFGHHVSGWILTGLMIGMVGTIPAHELTHRTWDPVSMLLGRWLLAFSFDASFAVEHVYGHHRYVSTEEDPATAPRGRNVYAHVAISTVKGNVSAWKIERARLAKRGLSTLSIHNAVLRGYAMSAALVALAYALGGAVGAGFFIACALWGKALLEIVNYMEHYGMVRDPATPVQPRHSWNTNRRISSWSMFNLTRHSHHHAQGEVAYQDLRPYEDAPMMINGYLTTLVVAMIPPLWHHLMTPKVLAWDRDYATEPERRLAARASARTGFARASRLRATA